MYPVYHQFFTTSEIREMVRFYRTPIGQKMTLVQPKLLEATVQVGQELGKFLQPKIEGRARARLIKEGLAK